MNSANPEYPRLQQFEQELRARLRRPLTLHITNNRRQVIRLSNAAEEVVLRINREFEQAPASFFEALTRYIIQGKRDDWKRVQEQVRNTTFEPRPRRPRTRYLYTQGERFNLEDLLTQVLETYFPELARPLITWTRASARRRKPRSIRYGSWVDADKLIRIHPRLDEADVPEEFVRYVIYHELCHAVAPPYVDSSGRRQIHHREFQELEARWPNLKQMEEYSKELLRRS